MTKVKISLELSEESARLLLMALDLYMRLGMGNISEVPNVLRSMEAKNYFSTPVSVDISDLEVNLRYYEKYFTNLPAGAQHSIRSSKVCEDSKVLYDIYCEIRSRMDSAPSVYVGKHTQASTAAVSVSVETLC